MSNFEKEEYLLFLGSVATMSNPDRFRDIFPNRRPIFAYGRAMTLRKFRKSRRCVD